MTSLVWLTLALSCGLASASYLGLIRKWPKIFYVSAASNAVIIALYYAPNMYGYHYYFADLVRTVPLILWLVYLCKEDPSPDWTYRGLCLVFILQIITGGWHILAGLQSPYYDGLALGVTLTELTILLIGGFNARLPTVGKRTDSACSTAVCSLWAKRDNEVGT